MTQHRSKPIVLAAVATRMSTSPAWMLMGITLVALLSYITVLG
ncbi:MAG: hypothetical protein R2857_06785 [Vampirovibrionales bacterium]